MLTISGRAVFGVPVAGAAPAALCQQYPFLAVPRSPKSVTTLFQDSRGRLWLGGPRSACFDGTRFFFLGDYGLPSGESYDFSEDPSGAIWIGAETGFSVSPMAGWSRPPRVSPSA